MPSGITIEYTQQVSEGPHRGSRGGGCSGLSAAAGRLQSSLSQSYVSIVTCNSTNYASVVTFVQFSMYYLSKSLKSLWPIFSGFRVRDSWLNRGLIASKSGICDILLLICIYRQISWIHIPKTPYCSYIINLRRKKNWSIVSACTSKPCQHSAVPQHLRTAYQATQDMTLCSWHVPC